MTRPTPQIKASRLAEALGLPTELYLKREDLHPYGSHKGRSIPLMIEKHAKEGWLDFVISSSGNAALAAAYHIKNHNSQPIKLKIFIGEKIDRAKMKILTDLAGPNIELRQVKNPRQSAFQADKAGTAKLLRQSTDDSALSGYFELAKELSAVKNLSAIFVPTSSGAAAQGLYEGFKKIGACPQIHIVQTSTCHPIASAAEAKRLPLPDSAKKDEVSLAGAIVDRIARRKEAVVNAIKKSNGSGWIATNAEILSAIKLFKQTTGIEISANSALSVAGLRQALSAGWEFGGPVVCLVTGR